MSWGCLARTEARRHVPEGAEVGLDLRAALALFDAMGARFEAEDARRLDGPALPPIEGPRSAWT